MNENNQQHVPTTPTGSWGVITEVDNGFNGQPAQHPKAKATQYIKATLAAFGPGDAMGMTIDTWAKLHEAMSVLIEQPAQLEPLTDKQEREAFGLWCAETIYKRPEFSASRGGYVSPDVWEAWKARAALGIKGAA